MAVLVDTSILGRLANRNDAAQSSTETAIAERRCPSLRWRVRFLVVDGNRRERRRALADLSQRDPTMAIAPDKFWGRNYYNHPALTDEMVAEAERQLAVKLPAEYIALLSIQNGGYTEGFAFPMTQRTTWAADHIPLNDLAGIVTDPEVRTAQNLLDTTYLTEEWGLPPRQVLLSGDGHWWITLDYRKGDVPSVAWIDVECGEDIQAAPSFTAFLDGLRPLSEFDDE